MLAFAIRGPFDFNTFVNWALCLFFLLPIEGRQRNAYSGPEKFK